MVQDRAARDAGSECRRNLPRAASSESWTGPSASTGSSCAHSRSSAPPASPSASRRSPPATDKVSIATFNVENLDRERPEAKFDTLAGIDREQPRGAGHRQPRGDPGQQRATNDGIVDADVTLEQAASPRSRPRAARPTSYRRSTRSTTRTAASPAATSASASSSAPIVASLRRPPGRRLHDRRRGRRRSERQPAAVVQPGPRRPDQRGLERQPQATGGRVHASTARRCS